MNITFYQFAKRTNSTKIVNTEPTTLACELKGSTTVFNPSLILKTDPPKNPFWNYCYIPTFERFYFINNWTWLNGVWECQCVCDVLASFKTDIGNMTEYVMRSSYEYDGWIQDNTYITKAEVHSHMQQLPEFYVRSATAGFYIVGIIGKESTATQGAITYYQMTPAEMATLRAYLLSDTFLTDNGLVNMVDFIPADATKVIYNPYQYIVSCKWFPFDPSVIPAAFKTSVSTINFGWWQCGTGISAYMLSASIPVYTRSEDITLYQHPQIARGYFMNHSPYTTRVLRMTPFGEVQLPDEYLTSIDKLTIELQCDFITGMGALLLHARTQTGNLEKMLMTRMTAMIGVEIQLAQVGSDYLGAVTGQMADKMQLYNSVKSALSNIDVTSAPALIASAGIAGFEVGAADMIYQYNNLNNYLNAKAPQLLTSGSNGSMLMFAQNNYLCTTCYLVVDDDNAQLGRPLCAMRTLKNIPGFIMVRSPDVSIACFDVEKALIKQFLTTGFFYE